MLRIEHLTKTYGDKKAVDDLSLHILPGEIYGFIGHNGAGKTLNPWQAFCSLTRAKLRSMETPCAISPWPAKKRLLISPIIPTCMII